MWILSTRPTSSNFTKSRKRNRAYKRAARYLFFFSLTSALFKKTLGLLEKCPSIKIVSLRQKTHRARKKYQAAIWEQMRGWLYSINTLIFIYYCDICHSGNVFSPVCCLMTTRAPILDNSVILLITFSNSFLWSVARFSFSIFFIFENIVVMKKKEAMVKIRQLKHMAKGEW